eukprot:scaffold37474_cov50-Phaeocystis_antarctica.AAC.1
MADVEATARFPPLQLSSPPLHRAPDEAEYLSWAYAWGRACREVASTASARCASDPWRFLQRAPIALAQPPGALDPHLCSSRSVSHWETWQKPEKRSRHPVTFCCDFVSGNRNCVRSRPLVVS